MVCRYVFLVLYHLWGLPGMISLVFRYASDDWNASSEDIEYKVRHVTVSRWSSGPPCGIHSGDPSEHGRNAAGMRTERMGSPSGDPMNIFFR